MKKNTILVLAVLVFVMPFLGFPQSWKTIIYMALGLALALNAYRDDIRRFFTISESSGLVEGDSYVESPGPTQ